MPLTKLRRRRVTSPAVLPTEFDVAAPARAAISNPTINSS
jgi:hypothetical protein